MQNALVDASFDRCSYETRFSLSRWDPESLGFSLVEALLYHICTKERPGAVLVFMTGWEDINALKEKLMSHSLMGDKRRVLVLACHGGMASAEQVCLLIADCLLCCLIYGGKEGTNAKYFSHTYSFE